ncbi:hypothetical protein AH448_15800 [Salmonella enterica subsp. diarizonae]|uniref:Uncharacterized protein n=6 Tax=Salmonella enterica TaxID=28901 RepID=A0A3T3KY02_SALDZ|nr:hypothetical protein DOE63_03705 [Salmonella enterica subsp. diarizonae serovar 59:z10:-]AXC72851.1 hypothetical protein DOE59_15515 [Salmonella enterica subsp. diarizonae serovar 48:i:z]AXD10100.1 hypothetical protein CHE29_14945 [Salmonella enterica]EAA0679327.1 hypothetical protein [Salmonella enterica subsp. diarizonae]EAA7932421.1 hypothetical protein [Salmonella enterica subsp. enterica serovar Redlands]EAS9235214.1 hypothetical protein [Salmonella enterica subsp. enterica]EBE3718741
MLQHSSVLSLYRILCKCLFSEVTVQAVTEPDKKSASVDALSLFICRRLLQVFPTAQRFDTLI